MMRKLEQEVKSQTLDENMRQTRIITEEIQKEQEIINKNLWTIFE